MKRLVLLFLPFLACSSNAQNNVWGDPNFFMPGVSLAELTDPKLGEVSGIAASAYNSGYLWTQNDSGNSPQIFLIDKNLNIKLTCTLKGVMNRDWEDIAVGPGPDPKKSYVYVADIGDNLGMFPTKFIYRFEEPVLDSAIKQVIIKDFKRIVFRLPGGEVKDSETMLLEPGTRNLYILSKEDSAHLYEIAFAFTNSDSNKDTVIARDLGTYNLPVLVAGAVSDDGGEILIKNYRRILYWRNPMHKPIAEVLREHPAQIPYAAEPQGEAITWAHDRSGFYTLSEKRKDKKSFLYFYKRK
jgi:hypothetical protein